MGHGPGTTTAAGHSGTPVSGDLFRRGGAGGNPVTTAHRTAAAPGRCDLILPTYGLRYGNPGNGSRLRNLQSLRASGAGTPQTDPDPAIPRRGFRRSAARNRVQGRPSTQYRDWLIGERLLLRRARRPAVGRRAAVAAGPSLVHPYGPAVRSLGLRPTASTLLPAVADTGRRMARQARLSRNTAGGGSRRFSYRTPRIERGTVGRAGRTEEPGTGDGQASRSTPARDTVMTRLQRDLEERSLGGESMVEFHVVGTRVGLTTPQHLRRAERWKSTELEPATLVDDMTTPLIAPSSRTRCYRRQRAAGRPRPGRPSVWRGEAGALGTRTVHQTDDVWRKSSR